VSTDRAEVAAYLQAHKEENIARTREYLRQPTVSSNGRGIREGAELLTGYLRELGCQEVTLLETAGYPGVWAYLDSGAKHTLISYCMYDTKPAREDLWPVPPFAAALEDLPGLGRAVLAPGAKSRKAPYIQWLNALRAVLAVRGKLPVNIAFLAEGEENLGSPHYGDFIDQYRDRLKGAVGCLAPGACQGRDGNVEIHLGHKGLLYLKLTASGRSWGRGPQATSGHGMAQTLVDSPVWHLVAALNVLYNPDQDRVLVPGFYDQLRPPTAQESAEIHELATQFRDLPWQKVLPGIAGAKTSRDMLSHEEAFERYLYGPSFNINGIAAGYTGPGSPVFTLPNEAFAQFDIRLPRGYRTREVADLIRRHLDAEGFGDIELEVLAAHDPARTPVDSPFVRAWDALIREQVKQVEYWPYSGGGGPWSKFTSDFGIPVLFDAGLGHGGKAGGPGEFLVLESEGPIADSVACEAFYAEFLDRVADL
jgi:acetylornithine deacetylase/succinyl-diaminopimelate desuccinylase-like protein